MLLCASAAVAAPAADEFAQSIRPVLEANCTPCHSAKARVNFLKAATSQDIESNRSLWRNVAAQLRNRTMPPGDAKLAEEDRLRIAAWIDNRLRQTACAVGDYAGAVAIRRLNRREYHNTVRDLLGIDFNVSEFFPADGSGGAGFDTNGETLYIPPVLMERYLDAAQQVLDRVIVTPALDKTYPASPAMVSIYADADYDVSVSPVGTFKLKIDEGAPLAMTLQQSRPRPGRGGAAPSMTARIHLARGLRQLSIVGEGAPLATATITVQQRPAASTPEKLALHYRLLGAEPGAEPVQPRKAAGQILRRIVRQAYRRPIETADIAPLLTLYDRAAQRGDPFEERVKLALKAVLVSPDFLFKLERRNEKPGIYPIGQYEMASRLSYFFWSTMPDAELDLLAAEGKLQDPKTLTAQVERMLDDPRAHAFTSTFIGQWLGTQDLGGRVAPMLTEIQEFYNPPVAADLRAEPILIFERILAENRSLLDLIDGNYTYLTERLVKFYQLEDQFKDLHGNEPRFVQWPDPRRAGVITSGAVLAMTSHYNQSSPVLRGAWVLDTLLGTPVPPPPPNVPPLETGKKKAVHMREKTLEHRNNPACSACHKLMDPIGFALENFDWTGRWRDKESDGTPIDASGALASGEAFIGPVELRQVLLGKKEDFLRHLSGKVLAYALGRNLQDGDSCTVQHLVDALQKDNYRARTLMREIVLSTPFRNSQGGKVTMETTPPPPPKRTVPMVVK